MSLLFGVFIGIALTGVMLDNVGLALMAGFIAIIMYWLDKNLTEFSDPVLQAPPRVPVISTVVVEDCEYMCSYSDPRFPIQTSRPDLEI